MIVLDTNVVSELMRAEPHPAVIEWLGRHPNTSLFTTTLTQAEIFYGLRLLPEGKRRTALMEAADLLFENDMAGRVLPFDTDSAHFFALIAAERRAAGRPVSQIDCQIAAIVRSRGAALATRNVRDFEDCGISVFDPWEER